MSADSLSDRAGVFRFAPSPNGELHLGHAYSALLNAELARRNGGRFLLRIEDIDTARCTPEFEVGIFRDLEWLGLQWEEPVRRQSEHFDDYRAALDRLIEHGLVYPAFMSRGEVRSYIAGQPDKGRKWPRDPDGAPLYPPADKGLTAPERRRRIDAGEMFAWRLDMDRAAERLGQTLAWRELAPQPPHEVGIESSPRARHILSDAGIIQAKPARWGDVILARKDTPTSYHLSVVVDDALQGVTHVVRGSDLYEATSVHRLLQELLGLPEPKYHHHRLMLGPDGRKLSKSERSTGLRALREGGASPAEIRRLVGL